MNINTLMEQVDSNLSGDLPSTDMSNARLYSIDESGDAVVAGEHGDVYDLLANPLSSLVAKMSHAVALETCGWASPLPQGDDEYEGVAPSQHPERRRVRLLVVANPTGTASALRFGDDWLNPIYDYGNAVGSLAEAVGELFA